MITSGLFDTDATILLSKVASPGDWYLLPPCRNMDELGGPMSLILIARRGADPKQYDIFVKGLGRRQEPWR